MRVTGSESSLCARAAIDHSASAHARVKACDFRARLEPKVPGSLLCQERFGFPALAIVFRRMGTVVKRVDLDTFCPKLTLDFVVDLIHCSDREHPATDPRLIGNYDQQETRIVE